jgi:transcriptional regulator with XRE-family HTH domain
MPTTHEGVEIMSKPNDFGCYLRAKRIDARLSVRALAQQVGISHVYLGEVERGERGPLDRRHWPKLLEHVKGITLPALERAAATSRPLQLEITDRPAEYQDLAFALARRIEKQDMDAREIKKILRVLEGSSRE